VTAPQTRRPFPNKDARRPLRGSNTYLSAQTVPMPFPQLQERFLHGSLLTRRWREMDSNLFVFPCPEGGVHRWKARVEDQLTESCSAPMGLLLTARLGNPRLCRPPIGPRQALNPGQSDPGTWPVSNRLVFILPSIKDKGVWASPATRAAGARGRRSQPRGMFGRARPFSALYGRRRGPQAQRQEQSATSCSQSRRSTRLSHAPP
jgi:hypothetical protein